METPRPSNSHIGILLLIIAVTAFLGRLTDPVREINYWLGFVFYMVILTGYMVPVLLLMFKLKSLPLKIVLLFAGGSIFLYDLIYQSHWWLTHVPTPQP